MRDERLSEFFERSEMGESVFFGKAVPRPAQSIRSNEYKKRVIQARSNVGVLNMPSPETEHWVESIPMHADVRIALSDWLL